MGNNISFAFCEILPQVFLQFRYEHGVKLIPDIIFNGIMSAPCTTENDLTSHSWILRITITYLLRELFAFFVTNIRTS